jgi:hypothetical protein
MRRISKKQLDILEKCIMDQDKELLKNIYGLQRDQYNKLRELVGNELICNGFDVNYNVNEYGRELEGLIDILGDFVMGDGG